MKKQGNYHATVVYVAATIVRDPVLHSLLTMHTVAGTCMH